MTRRANRTPQQQGISHNCPPTRHVRGGPILRPRPSRSAPSPTGGLQEIVARSAKKNAGSHCTSSCHTNDPLPLAAAEWFSAFIKSASHSPKERQGRQRIPARHPTPHGVGLLEHSASLPPPRIWALPAAPGERRRRMSPPGAPRRLEFWGTAFKASPRPDLSLKQVAHKGPPPRV